MRDQLLELIRRRLLAIDSAGGLRLPLAEDYASALLREIIIALEGPVTGRDQGLLSREIRLLRCLVEVAPGDWRYRGLALVSLSDALMDRYRLSGELENVDDSLAAMRLAADADGGDYSRVMLAARSGTALCTRYVHTGDRDCLDEAVRVLRPVAGTPVDAEYGSLALSALAEAVLHRWQAGGRAEDADEAVALYQRVVAATPQDDTNWPGRVSNLGTALLQRYRESQDPADIEESIERQRAGVAATPPGTPSHTSRLGRLGTALHARYGATGRRKDLADALTSLRAAVPGLSPSNSEHAQQLAALARALDSAHAHYGDPALLDELITVLTVLRSSGERRPEDRADRVELLCSLGGTLHNRYLATGQAGDLDEAVKVLGDAVNGAVDTLDTTHGTRDRALTLYGQALRSRCELTGDRSDADEAVRAHRAALDATRRASGDRPREQSALGLTLCSRFELTGELSDADEAVTLLRAAVDSLPESDPRRPATLSDLGLVLAARYWRTGAAADLDEAIQAHRAAVAAPNAMAAGAGQSPRAAQEAQERGRRLLNLAGPLRVRFERTGRRADLDEAIDALRGAAEEGSHTTVDRHLVLRDLGAALLLRAQRTLSPTDLRDAIEALHAAVDAVPIGHPARPQTMAYEAAALVLRFREGGGARDLDEAVELGRAAVGEAPASHPAQPHLRHVAGSALYDRFRHSGEEQDRAEARDTLRRAADHAPAHHPLRSGLLLTLAHVLADGPPSERVAAVEAYRTVAGMRTAPAHLRCEAARWWGTTAARDGEWQAALEGFAAAIGLLPLTTARGTDRADQEFQLGWFRGLAADAAACATRCGDPELGLELLEQGRGILLGRALETHAELPDLAELRERHPELARRFADIRALLDAPAPPGAPPREEHAGGRSDRLDRLAREFDELLTDIRGLPGFGHFLLPPRVPDLLPLAAEGPVVALNISPYGAHALILTADGVHPEPLNGLDPKRLGEMAALLLGAVEATRDGSRPYAARVVAAQHVRGVLGWLWDVIAEPVLGHLGLAGGRAPGAPWPRVWWMPTGLLSFLPLHAAGHYGRGRGVLDCVISSYTPTLRGLRHARSRSRAAGPGASAVVVVVPDAPELPGLTESGREADVVVTALPGAVLLSGAAATPERIADALAEASIAHFACHAIADVENPSASHLVVSGGETLTVTRIAARPGTGGHLAYLSACATARGGAALADEAIHISSAFQLAGFSHVIASLWPLADASARALAEEAYELGVAIDPARALHEAIRRLRDHDPGNLADWAAPVHTGP
jgi:tetratricopeptide (TPR) repeat protein